MLSHFIDSVRQFFATGSPLEIGLLIVAIVAIGVGLRVRAVRAAAKKGSADIQPPAPSDLTPMPTARQWLARETAMNNDLPPPRETVIEPQPIPVAAGAVATVAPPPPAQSESRTVDDAIVFPTGRGFGDYRTVDLPPPRNGVAPEPLPEAGTIASILSDGLDDLATGGDRLAEAIRERPVQYFFGALAAGFAAGLMFPVVYGQQRVAKLLERLIESNEELKHVRLEDRREARLDIERRESERFRQSRPS